MVVQAKRDGNLSSHRHAVTAHAGPSLQRSLSCIDNQKRNDIGYFITYYLHTTGKFALARTVKADLLASCEQKIPGCMPYTW
jgi:hypothetical protein